MVLLLLLLVMCCGLPTTSLCIESGATNICYQDDGVFTLSIPETNIITFVSGIGSSTTNAETVSITATPTALQLTQTFLYNAIRFTVIELVVPSGSSNFDWTTTWVSHSPNVTGFDDSSAALLVNITTDPTDMFWTPYVAFPPLSTQGYLAPFPFHAADFVYGTELDPPQDDDTGNSYQTAYPSMTLFSGDVSAGVTFLSSLDDPIINARVSLDPSTASCLFKYYRVRLNPLQSRSYTRHILIHEPYPRSSLASMQARYPAYAEPNQAVIADLWGSAQYHDYRGNTYNVSRWDALNFKVYWDATFPFGWWGDYLPSVSNYSLCVPVGHANTVVPWSKYPVPTHPNSDYKCDTLSYDTVAGWYNTAKKNGFQALVYANVVGCIYPLAAVDHQRECFAV
jgi:hypothetical protein